MFSLPKSAIGVALDVSEYALLLFGVTLAIGIIGEYSKAEKWKVRKRIFEIMVIIGVAGEIFADGGIFLFSRNLQTISDREVADLNKEAGDARKAAGNAITEAGSANERAGKAVERASRADERASTNEKEAARLSKEAASLTKIAEDERIARVKIEDELKWRTLSEEQTTKLLAALPALFIGVRVQVSNIVGDAEGAQYASELSEALRRAGWVIDGPNAAVMTGILPEGVAIQVGDLGNRSAITLQRAFVAAGIQAEGVFLKGMNSESIGLFVGVKPHPRIPPRNKK